MAEEKPKKTEKKPLKKGTNGGKREGSGRKPIEPNDLTRMQVRELGGLGLQLEQIALIQNISLSSLKMHYKHELSCGKAIRNAEMAESIFKQGKEGNATLAIWYSKCQMGWKDTSKPEPIVSNNEDKQALIADALKVLAANLPV